MMFSCKNNLNEIDNQQIGFTSDIATDTKGKQSLFESIKLIRDSLKLDTLENGYDSLQIRFWIGYSFTSKQQVIILKNQQGNWKSYYCEYMPHYIKNTDSLIYFEKNIINKVPKSSWNTFIDKLYSYDVLILPDYSKLTDYPIPNDANGITIEVSTKNSYRLYHYPSPGLARGFSEARNMENILNLVIQELDIKLLASI